MTSTSQNLILPTAAEMHEHFAGCLDVRKRTAASIVNALGALSLSASLYEDREATGVPPSSLLLAGRKPAKTSGTRANWSFQLAGVSEDPPAAWNATLRLNVEADVPEEVSNSLDALSQECAHLADTRRVDLPSVSTEAGAYEMVMGMVVAGPGMRQVVDHIHKYASESGPALIIGETGTGKERIAQALHDASGRTGKKVVINCACIPADLIAAELFGYERGAFSGANRAKNGAFQDADRGTLFLDEIGDMPMEQQTALLRVLQEGTVRKVGCNTEKAVDVRVVAATHRNLKDLVAEGTFRQDLFYRLDVLTITVPPLRERPDEIVPLVKHHLNTTNSERGLNLTITEDALALLQSHSWPGNVRELVNCLERARIHADGETIDAKVLNLDSVFNSNGEGQGIEALSVALNETSFDEQVQTFARSLITTAVEKTGSPEAAAGFLQMPESVLRQRAAELGLQDLIPAASGRKTATNLRSVASRRPQTTSAAAVA